MTAGADRGSLLGGMNCREHIAPILSRQPGLPGSFQVHFKAAAMIFKTLRPSSFGAKVPVSPQRAVEVSRGAAGNGAWHEQRSVVSGGPHLCSVPCLPVSPQGSETWLISFLRLFFLWGKGVILLNDMVFQ